MRLNPLDYWTVFLFRKLRPWMTLNSILRFRMYQSRVAKGNSSRDRQLVLRMKAPIRGSVFLREDRADLGTFSEVFIEEVYRGAVTRLPQCRTIIDLGANIGLASLYFAKSHPEARILAVEPHPENFELLSRNLHNLIGSGRCAVLRSAVWSAERPLVAATTKAADHYNVFVVSAGTPSAADPFKIKGFSMPSLMKEAGFEHVDLVKVDIEGSEVELFRGESSWLANVGALAIEFHGSSRTDCGFDGKMRQYGFSVYDQDRHTVVAVKKAG